VREPIIESSAPENSSRKSFLGENAAVLAESSGERPHRHAVVLASRRWLEAMIPQAETRRDNLTEALGLTSGILGKSKEGALGASGSLKSSLGACEKINQ
jgi:hypothetical protein